MLYFVALISFVLAAEDCTQVKDEEFVPHCGKCMYDRQCIGWNSFKEAANKVGKASFVYCCPNLKRCLQADPENPNNYRYEMMRCPSGAGWPEGDDTKPADCMDYMTETVKQSNWRGNRDTPGCSERSKDYPAGCQCANPDWPNSWATGCDAAGSAESEETERETVQKVDESAETEEPPKKVDESAEKVDESAEKEEPMTCDACAATFVKNGGCTLWKSGAGEKEIMGALPSGCDGETCSPQMWEQCQACDKCAVGFSENGGCEVAQADDATLEKVNALLPSDCDGEYCMHSIGDYCMNKGMCEECVSGFVDNGGCGPAMRGENPNSYFPEGCTPNACATQAKAACMAEMEEDSSSSDDFPCPELECECKSYENQVITVANDGCEECTCVPKCNCFKSKCSKGKLPKCNVSKKSRCPDKKMVRQGRRKRYTSAVACMTLEEQAEWQGMMVAFEDMEPEEWTAEDFAIYGFAAIGAAAISYGAFSKIAGGRKYTPVESLEHETGEL